jgi:hypothetical protein
MAAAPTVPTIVKSASNNIWLGARATQEESQTGELAK